MRESAFWLVSLGNRGLFFFRDIWALNLGGGTIVFLRPFLAWSPSHQKNQWSVEKGRGLSSVCCWAQVKGGIVGGAENDKGCGLLVVSLLFLFLIVS